MPQDAHEITIRVEPASNGMTFTLTIGAAAYELPADMIYDRVMGPIGNTMRLIANDLQVVLKHNRQQRRI
jgi:hypothetical protein